MRRQTAPPQARLVEVLTVEASRHQAHVRAKGEVRPARRLLLAAQVSGRVQWISPRLEPGVRVSSDEVLLRIEDRDYALALRQREAALEQARRDLAVERGQSRVAIREFELSGLETDPDSAALSRREPQLRAAEAAVASAEAALELARLNLARTEIRAPYEAVVLDKRAELGGYLGNGTVVAELAGVEAAWIEALVPVDSLRWIRSSEANGDEASEVRIAGHPGRVGRVLRVLPELEPQGRLARVLVEVPNPLDVSHGGAPLLWGSYVSMDISGTTLENVIEIRRRYLRGPSQVHVMDDESRLRIREVEIAYRAEDSVFVSAGLSPGERLVTTDLPVAVEGMALRTADAGGKGGRP